MTGRPGGATRWTVAVAVTVTVTVVVAVHARGMGQQPDPGGPDGRARGGAADAASTAAARRIPDSLRFAHGLLRQRKFDLAAGEYQRFLATGPSGADRLDALFGLANARLDQGKYAESLRAFGDFLRAAPTDARARTARYRVGELSYLTGDLAAARTALGAFTAGGAGHPAMETAWTYLGDVAFALNDLTAARSSYERSLAEYPRGRLADRARYGLARTLAGLGQRDRALDQFRELARRGGTEWVDRSWLQIGSIELAAGRPEQALEALTTLERVAPASTLGAEARLGRARALHRLDRSDEARRICEGLLANPTASLAAQAALELATIELEHKRPESALTAVSAVLGRRTGTPLRPALLFRSAEALRQLNRRDEAQARFLEVVQTAPVDPWADDALERAAATALERKDAATARRLASELTVKYPASPLRGEARLIEARAAAMAGDHRSAAGLLERLLEPAAPGAGPAAPPLSSAVVQDARYELALAYRALGRPADADKLLAKLAGEPAGPAAADAQFLVGQAHVEAGRHAEAITPLERYLAANPRGDVAEFALADLVAARLGAGRITEAERTLARLANEFPAGKTLPRARLRFAEAALDAGESARAIELFRLVAGTGDRPSAVDRDLRMRALTGLGRALQQAGQPADAAAAFRAALDLAPDDPAVPGLALARGRALEAANRPEEALSTYQSIVKRFAARPEGPRAALAMARLLARIGRHAPAAAEYERLSNEPHASEALSKAGVTPDTLLAELGWTLVDASKPAEADRVFTRLLKDFPDSPHAADARFNLAESANQARNYPEVVRLLTPLVAARPAAPAPAPAPTPSGDSADPSRLGPAADSSDRLLPAVLYRLGRTQVELRDWPAAATTLDRLLGEFPENRYRREARFLRAEASLQLGDAAAAEKGFAALLAGPAPPGDDPEFRRSARLERIRCWVALERWKDAIEAVQTFRGELKPDDPVIAELDFALGQAQMGMGRMEEARQSFQAVVAARKGGELAARAQLLRGETFFHEDRLREALREFLQVDILYDAPRWQAAALLEVGKVYERLDQWADAAETYQGLASRFPREPAAETARSRGEAARRRAETSAPASVRH